MVPSPPQAMISLTPFRAASADSSIPSPALDVKAIENEPKCVRRSLAIFGHAARVAPPADSGFTIINGSDISVCVLTKKAIHFNAKGAKVCAKVAKEELFVFLCEYLASFAFK